MPEGVRDLRTITLSYEMSERLRLAGDGKPLATWDDITRHALEKLADLEAENTRLKDALHEDQTGLAAAISEMVRLASARAWILDGRGLYEWDDDEYRKEAGYALTEIIDFGRNALLDSGNLAHGEDGCRRERRWVPIVEVVKEVDALLKVAVQSWREAK